MTTRQNMRRELQDLAKLASTIPAERPTPPPPAHALERPPTPSRVSVTIPPSVASIPAIAVQSTSAPRTAKRSRGSVIGLAVAGLALAIVGGAAFGRTLAHRAPPAAAAAAAAPAPAVIVASPVKASPVEVPAPVAVMPPQGAITTAPVAPVAPTPAVATVAVAPSPPPQAPIAATRRTLPPPRAAAAPKPSLVANIPTSGGGSKNSLEDAIRKAVAASPK
jgi:hypothetical protein